MGTTASVAIRPMEWKEWLKSGMAFLNELFPRKKAVEMSVAKSVPLGQKANATLLVVNGERLLLGVTSSSVSVLRQWKRESEELEVRGRVR
jgi:flagellar biogenesis protein FliO